MRECLEADVTRQTFQGNMSKNVHTHVREEAIPLPSQAEAERERKSCENEKEKHEVSHTQETPGRLEGRKNFLFFLFFEQLLTSL